MTTLSRRALEDATDEAQANLSDIRRRIQCLGVEHAILLRDSAKARLDIAAYMDEATALVEQAIDQLTLAERAAEQEARRLAVAAE